MPSSVNKSSSNGSSYMRHGSVHKDELTFLDQLMFGIIPNQENKDHIELLTQSKSNKNIRDTLKLASQNDDGETALIYACKMNQPTIASLIIDISIDEVGIIDKKGRTALIYACGSKMSRAALKLIQTGKSNPGQVSNDKLTALILACKNKMETIALELIKTGKSNPDQGQINGKSAMQLARKNNMHAVVNKLATIANVIDKDTTSPNEFELKSWSAAKSRKKSGGSRKTRYKKTKTRRNKTRYNKTRRRKCDAKTKRSKRKQAK